MWRRKKDENCRIPNKLLYRINAGTKGSFSCSFSNNGLFLAIAGADHNSYPIKVYHFETGERLATLDGHLDLVYQLSWSQDDCELTSSSSDGSVRVWGFMADGTVQQVAIFLHPTFVYCASFHPTESEPR
jgi:WD40 repeat protein